MQSAAETSYGISIADNVMAAASRTVPAAVTHEFSAAANGRRSAPGASCGFLRYRQTRLPRSSSNPIIYPARDCDESAAASPGGGWTACAHLEQVDRLFTPRKSRIHGRQVGDQQTDQHQTQHGLRKSKQGNGGVLEISNPSVNSEDPLKRKTANRSPTPNAQYMAAYPTKINRYQVGSRSSNPIGA